MCLGIGYLWTGVSLWHDGVPVPEGWVAYRNVLGLHGIPGCVPVRGGVRLCQAGAAGAGVLDPAEGQGPLDFGGPDARINW